MIAQANALTAWLLDAYAAATVLLLAGLVAGILVRQPVQRMATAWATMLGLAVVLVAAAMPGWPRVSLFVGAVAQSTDDSAAQHVAPRKTTPLELSKPVANAEFTALPTPSAHHAQAVLDLPESIESDISRSASPDRNWRLNRAFIGAYAAMLWAVGALVVTLWLSAGAISAVRLCRQAVPAPEAIQAELMQLVGNRARTPRLLVSPALPTAAVCGVIRPQILLPHTALAESARSALPMLLAHEWAHIAKRDLWLLLLGRILLIALYAHPLYWLLRRRVAMDQELVADACAAGLCGRQQYAEQLFEWARRLKRRAPRLTWGMGMDDRPGQLSRRITMLLDEKTRLETHCGKRWRLATTICCAAAVTLLSLITLQPGREVRAEPADTSPNLAEPLAPNSAAEKASPETKATLAANADDDNQPADPADVERIIKRLEMFTTAKVDLDQSKKMTRAELARWQREYDRVLAEGQMKIAGVCHDEAGQPVAGARWRLFHIDYRAKSQNVLQDVVTDDAGRFQFWPVDGPFLKRQPVRAYSTWWGAPTLYLVGQAPGRGTVLWHVFAGDPNDKLEFKMYPAAALTGTVVDVEGRPVAGATVTATRQGLLNPVPGVRSEITDESGRYRINDLAAWRPGDTPQPPDDEGRLVERTSDYASVDHPEYAPLGFEYASIPGTFDVTLSRPATITGRVTIDGTDEPAKNATVELRWGNSMRPTTTDDDGRYEFTRVAPRTCQIDVRLAGKPTTIRRGIEVRSGDNEIDVRIAKGGTIRGRITELTTGQPPLQQPLEQFTLVTLQTEQGEILETAALEADGSFTIHAPAGPAQIGIFELGGGSSVPYRGILLESGKRAVSKRVEVVAGETLDINLRLIAPGEDEEEFDEEVVAYKQVLSEQAAAAAISKLGGWTKAEKIDNVERIVEVNMIYFDKEDGTRLENKFYTDESLDYVRKFPQLKLLALTRGQANDRALANLRGLEQLKMFCVYEAWNITDAAVDHLIELPALDSVELIDAQQLTDAAVKKLSQIKRLENIGVTGGSLSDASLQYVARLENLQSLYLGSSVATFTDDGLKYLAGLEKLETLSIEGRGITDAGLEHLRGLKKLKHLEVDGTAVTEAGAARLREVLPDLEVSGCRKVDVPPGQRD